MTVLGVAQNGVMTSPDLGKEVPRADGWIRRRERVSRHIERSALELIAFKGPDNVTVEEMAEAAGISVRTFFRYFRTREDVMSALPNRANRALAARVVARPSSEGVLDAFRGAVSEAQIDPGDAEEAPIDAELMILWGRARQHWPLDSPASWMITTYAEAIAERLGSPVDDPDVEIMATAIANVMWVAFRRWLQSGGDGAFNVVVEECFAVLAQLNMRAGKEVGRTPASSG
jgi:AcrR family transcriptional regulator